MRSERSESSNEARHLRYDHSGPRVSEPGGLADELLTLAAEERFELVLSSAIVLETWRTLIASDHIRARYPCSDERTHIFCLSLDEIATNVLRSTRALTGIVRDPRDDMGCGLRRGRPSRHDRLSRQGLAVVQRFPGHSHHHRIRIRMRFLCFFLTYDSENRASW